MKAKYIGKRYGTSFDRDSIYLEYEYRGYKYEVYENKAKGNEPLPWQHKREQDHIDKIIKLHKLETPGKPAWEVFNDLCIECGW